MLFLTTIVWIQCDYKLMWMCGCILFKERESTSQKILKETSNSYLIPPFDHPDIIAGQGSIGLELLEQVCLFCILLKNKYTVEPLVATSSHKRPPLLSDQFSKIPKVSKSNHYIWHLL